MKSSSLLRRSSILFILCQSISIWIQMRMTNRVLHECMQNGKSIIHKRNEFFYFLVNSLTLWAWVNVVFFPLPRKLLYSFIWQWVQYFRERYFSDSEYSILVTVTEENGTTYVTVLSIYIFGRNKYHMWYLVEHPLLMNDCKALIKASLSSNFLHCLWLSTWIKSFHSIFKCNHSYFVVLISKKSH